MSTSHMHMPCAPSSMSVPTLRPGALRRSTWMNTVHIYRRIHANTQLATCFCAPSTAFTSQRRRELNEKAMQTVRFLPGWGHTAQEVLDNYDLLLTNKDCNNERHVLEDMFDNYCVGCFLFALPLLDWLILLRLREAISTAVKSICRELPCESHKTWTTRAMDALIRTLSIACVPFVCPVVACYMCCPPIPSMLIERHAFKPPPHSYDWRVTQPRMIVTQPPSSAQCLDWTIGDMRKARHKRHRSFNVEPDTIKDCADKQYSYVRTSLGHFVPVLIVQPTLSLTQVDGREDMIILFSQPNASDLGSLMPMQYVADYLQCSLALYDYPGYGLATGKPTVNNCLDAIRSVYEHLVQLGWQGRQMVAWGMSLGTGCTVQLASEVCLAGVLLCDSFTALTHVLTRDRMLACGIADWCPLVRNDLHSIALIHQIMCPVLYVHGKDDRLCKLAHATHLHANTTNAVPPLWLDQTGHCESMNRLRFWQRFKQFVDKEVPRITKTNMKCTDKLCSAEPNTRSAESTETHQT